MAMPPLGEPQSGEAHAQEWQNAGLGNRELTVHQPTLEGTGLDTTTRTRKLGLKGSL